MIGLEFEVWVCPECRGIYAAQSIQGLDLSEMFNTDLKNSPTFARSRCPNCSTPDKEVHRIWCIARVIKEVPRGDTPMTEEEYWRHIEERQQQRGAQSEGTSGKDFPVRSSSLTSEP